jgi:hypothetical protein
MSAGFDHAAEVAIGLAEPREVIAHDAEPGV